MFDRVLNTPLKVDNKDIWLTSLFNFNVYVQWNWSVEFVDTFRYVFAAGIEFLK